MEPLRPTVAAATSVDPADAGARWDLAADIPLWYADATGGPDGG